MSRNSLENAGGLSERYERWSGKTALWRIRRSREASVIKGTRVPVRIIVDALAGGSSVEEVCAGWRITREDVLAALGYAADAV
jgi:hypothetical protein